MLLGGGKVDSLGVEGCAARRERGGLLGGGGLRCAAWCTTMWERAVLQGG